MYALDMLSIAGELLKQKNNDYLFSTNSPVHKPPQEHVAVNPDNGVLHLKRYVAESVWDKGRVLENLQKDILQDFELAPGILEKDPQVLSDYSVDVCRGLVDRLSGNDNEWFLFHIATNAKDESSIIYLILEVITKDHFVVTKLNAGGGYNSQVILSRLRLMSPDYEQYMCKTKH